MKVLMRLRKSMGTMLQHLTAIPTVQFKPHVKVFAFLGKPVGITQEMVDLTATTALEHFTATIASQLLVNNHIQELMSDETMKTMWLWHAIEENEHKAVAYDVFEGVFWKGNQILSTTNGITGCSHGHFILRAVVFCISFITAR
jgi:predicted metal-dependent hydrolase